MLKLLNGLKKFGNVLYYALVVGIVLISITTFFTVSNTPFKYKLFLVQSGSMSPAIRAGSLVVVTPQTTYTVGDIITFYLKTPSGKNSIRSTATHRIVQINETASKVQYQTKGDANASPDLAPVESVSVLGSVLFSIPLIGYILGFARTQWGFVVLVVIPATIIAYSELLKIKKELVDYFKKKKKPQTPPGVGPIAGVLFFALFAYTLTGASLAYTDNTASSGNSVRTLLFDMGIDSDTDSFSSGYDELARGDSVTRNSYVQNFGDMSFKYKQFYEFSSGASALCEGLDLKVTYEGAEKYSGKLKDYELNFSGAALPVLVPADEKMFEYEISVADDAPYIISSKTCVFNIVTVAWQEEYTNESEGFSDIETLTSSLSTSDWTPEPPTGLTVLSDDGDDLMCSGITTERDVTLDWNDSPEFDLAHYTVQDTALSIIASPINSQEDLELPDSDGEYRYRITAVDLGANESDFSSWCAVTLDRTIQAAEGGDVVINELMWSGSTVSGSDEWLELYNTTDSDIKLKNWVIENAGDGGDLLIPADLTISAHSYFLISRYGSDDSSSALADSVSVDWAVSELNLDNDGEHLVLKDAFGNEIDETDSGTWVAGEDATQKRSMERNDDPESGWHTCMDSACNDTTYWDVEGDDYGTPKAENKSENDPSEVSEPEVPAPLEEVSSEN